MKQYLVFAALLISSTFAVTADAQLLYWDIDTISQLARRRHAIRHLGFGHDTPNWNGNSDGSGVPDLWTEFSDAVFAAGSDATGSYTVTLGGTVHANSIAFEEGNVTISGGTELDVATSIDVASGLRRRSARSWAAAHRLRRPARAHLI